MTFNHEDKVFCFVILLLTKIKNSVTYSGVSEACEEKKKKRKEGNRPVHISAPGPGQETELAGSAGPGAKPLLGRASN